MKGDFTARTIPPTRVTLVFVHAERHLRTEVQIEFINSQHVRRDDELTFGQSGSAESPVTKNTITNKFGQKKMYWRARTPLRPPASGVQLCCG